MSLFHDYLSISSQVVKLKSTVSWELATSCDVPQESVLDPVLFRIYFVKRMIHSFIRTVYLDYDRLVGEFNENLFGLS